MVPDSPDDLGFYRQRLPSPDTSVLELGCGTGRVLVPLSRYCSYIHGVDSSEGMLAICEDKLSRAGVDKTRAHVELGDITCLELDKRFDLITAPWRVLQNLETDSEVDGLFATIRRHLKPAGRCILNVFKPWGDAEMLRREWCAESKTFCWETQMGERKLRLYERRASIDPENSVVYPELIFREFDGHDMVDETILKISMKCYFPEEFEQLITDHGFEVISEWGGYSGEPYGDGPELVIEFWDARDR